MSMSRKNRNPHPSLKVMEKAKLRSLASQARYRMKTFGLIVREASPIVMAENLANGNHNIKSRKALYAEYLRLVDKLEGKGNGN